MSLQVPSSLVSVDWLHQNLGNEQLVILFSSLKKVGVVGESGDSNNFIPNAIEFNIKMDFSDRNAEFPNTFPTVHQFENQASKLGITSDSCIVVYDNYGIYSAARVWWMFRTMGCNNIAVLNGGFPEWINAGYQTIAKLNDTSKKGNFKAQFNPQHKVDYAQVFKVLRNREYAIADARSESRFYGRTPEPRVGVRSGHIPASTSLPYTSLLDGNKMKPKEELDKIISPIFKDKKKVLFSCGTGITACVLGLGASVIGKDNFAIYDGSWTEWGSKKELPINK